MALKDIKLQAEKLNRLKSSKEFLYKSLNQIDQSKLQNLSIAFKPDGIVQPVVLLRFMIAQALLQNKLIDENKVDEFKKAIEERNISQYVEVSDDYEKNLQSYKKSSLGMFHQWKDPFYILFAFFYTEKEKINYRSQLKELGVQTIEELNLQNARFHPVDFYGSNNYGDDSIWGAIIPEDAPNVQRAYQLFFRISYTGIVGGIHKGHKINNPQFEEREKTYSSWDNYIQSLKELVPEWHELNSKINFDFQEDERVFKNRLKKEDKETAFIYIGILVGLVKNLSLTEEDNLVFSASSGQLSFQVGNRYCLNLKRGKFDFIAPIDYQIDGLNRSEFAEPDKASIYYKTPLGEMIKHIPAIMQSVQNEVERNVHTDPKAYDNAAFRRVIFDEEYQRKYFDFEKGNKIKFKSEEENPDFNLNQIFYGPPGTGKTFNSINRAVQITDPEFYEQYKANRKKITGRFKELLISDWEEPKGQIAFCTFHQSFSYEDFVEGIKPKVNDDKQVYYEIEPGIFKRICDLANSSKSSTKVKKEGKVAWSSDEFEKRRAEFFKLSLGEAKNVEDRAIYEFCIKNDYIAIGFGGNNDFSGMSETEIKELCNEVDENASAGSQLSTFIHGLRKGSYVLISKGNQYVRALGRIVGDYEYHDDFQIRYNHFKKVEWIFKDENIPAEELYEIPLTQRSLYKIDEDKLKKDFFVFEGAESYNEEPVIKPYVLIIDEINRGNISSIFGELITLIEKDKRSGGSEELEVTLPYSKETFMVPDNVYLLGTMNTADRSIEALDTALRRRFSFTEFPPDLNLITTESISGKTKGIVDNIHLHKLLETINKRIEKLIDKDHLIGHSYFLKVDSKSELKHSFQNEIIPLLEEYFYGDYGKIGLVLGSSFVEKETNNFKFADFEDYSEDLKDDLKVKPVYKISNSERWDFQSIYKS